MVFDRWFRGAVLPPSRCACARAVIQRGTGFAQARRPGRPGTRCRPRAAGGDRRDAGPAGVPATALSGLRSPAAPSRRFRWLRRDTAASCRSRDGCAPVGGGEILPAGWGGRVESIAGSRVAPLALEGIVGDELQAVDEAALGGIAPGFRHFQLIQRRAGGRKGRSRRGGPCLPRRSAPGVGPFPRPGHRAASSTWGPARDQGPRSVPPGPARRASYSHVPSPLHLGFPADRRWCATRRGSEATPAVPLPSHRHDRRSFLGTRSCVLRSHRNTLRRWSSSPPMKTYRKRHAARLPGRTPKTRSETA